MTITIAASVLIAISWHIYYIRDKYLKIVISSPNTEKKWDFATFGLLNKAQVVHPTFSSKDLD